MEKVKDYITIENGFFKNFKESHLEDYTLLLGDSNPEHLDRSIGIKGGARYAAPLLKEYLIKDVVLYLLTNNLDKWKKQKELLKLDYNVLNPYEQKKTTTQEKTGESIDTIKETEKRSVNTFDSQEAIEKDLDSSENTNTSSQNENVKITVETSGNVGNIAPTKLIIEEMEMRKTQLLDLIIKDVLKEISLDVY